MAFPFTAAAILGGSALSALSQNHANNKNLQATRETNAQNLEIFNRQFDYTKATQAEEWRRNDSELQRRVSDAQAAGLSPLAALGGNSSDSIISQPQAPHLMAPHVDSIMSNVNPDTLADAIIASRRLDVDQQNANTAERRMLNDKQIADLNLAQDAKINADKLAQADKQFTDSLKQGDKHFNDQLATSISQFNETLNRQLSVDNFNQKLAYQDYLIRDINSIVGEAKEKTGGQSSAYRLYSNQTEYQAAMNAWTARYADFITVELGKPTRQSVSQGQGSNADMNLNAHGQGAGLGSNYGAGQFSNSSLSQDFSERDRQKIVRWLNANPVPIYRPERRF